MRISIPSDYRLLQFDTTITAKTRIKNRLLFGPPGLFNAMRRRADDYVWRDEWLDTSIDVLALGPERKRKDMEQYQPIEIEIEPDSLLNFVRDLRDAGLIKCGEVYL